MELAAFQAQMRALYGERDRERGLARTFAWFTEECGELSRALFRGGHDERVHEFADVLAWLASLADQADVDLAEAARRYAGGCPRCGATPCACDRDRSASGGPAGGTADPDRGAAGGPAGGTAAAGGGAPAGTAGAGGGA